MLPLSSTIASASANASARRTGYGSVSGPTTAQVASGVDQPQSQTTAKAVSPAALRRRPSANAARASNPAPTATPSGMTSRVRILSSSIGMMVPYVECSGT